MATEHRRRVYRHRALTRVWHWANLFCLFFLLTSGLQIFNAYPRLHWGQFGANTDRAFIEIGPSGARGVTRIGALTFDTTGVLGVSNVDGTPHARAFPAWATLPSYHDLATGRRFHFFFAWLFVGAWAAYAVHAVVSRHLARDLLPNRRELSPAHLLSELWTHARLKVPRGEAELRYNTLQKLAYLGAAFLLLPMMILTGLTMSPGMNAAWPWLLDLFGGRQSARTLHFLSAALILLFVAVHVFQVMLVGPVRSVRSMLTGWWTVRE